jgi:outer membrane protein
MKNFLFIVLIFFLSTSLSQADNPFFIDFKYILNESKAGKKAQNSLKTKLENGLNRLKEQEKNIQEEEKKIIQQKKLITADEYKKKINGLRNKVSTLQKDRNKLLEDVSKQRTKARNELLKNLNPILKDYMKEKNIRIVLDKKSILLADENLNITDDIMKILNQKLISIKLN